MKRDDVIEGYMLNEKHVIAEMLYDTITRYEALQAPKTCEGCNNYGKNFGYGFDKDYCINLHMFTKDTFGCIEHDPKELV